MEPLGLKASLLGDGDQPESLGLRLVLSGAPATDAEVPAPPGCTPGPELRAGLLKGREEGRPPGPGITRADAPGCLAALFFRNIWLRFSLGNEEF